MLLLASAQLLAQSRWSAGVDGDFLVPFFDQADGIGTYSIYNAASYGAFVYGRRNGDGQGFMDGGLRYQSLGLLASGDGASNRVAVDTVGVEYGGGWRFELLDWLTMRAGGRLGIYQGFVSGVGVGIAGTPNPYAVAEAGVGFALNSSTSISVTAGYHYFSELLTAALVAVDGTLAGPSPPSAGYALTPLAQGLSISLGVSLGIGREAAGPRQPRIEIELPEFDPIFPVLYQFYNRNPVGSVTVTNGERETITDVRVSLLVDSYMDAPKEAIVLDSLAPGEAVDVPLPALFSEDILTVTEGTTAAAEVIAEYQVDDETLVARRSGTVEIRNRNNMTWDDDRKASAFVTANDPTVARFARNVSSAIRDSGPTELNDRLRLAMALYESLRIFGIQYQIDPDSSYIELSQDASAVDYIQFPQQTLDFRTGDCDDLSVLFTALLESVGIPSAFVTIPGHIYTAVDLGVDENIARRTFSTFEDLIVVDGSVWLPIEVTLVRDDFVSAWTTGAKQWRDNVSQGSAELLPVRDAWSTYQPTGFASQPLGIAIPEPASIAVVYGETLDRIIRREIEPQVADLQERLVASNNNVRVANRLGTLYARFGLYEEASEVFLSILDSREYMPALVNLGNLSYLESDLDSALAYYERADALNPDVPSVLLALARVLFDREEYDDATERFRQAQVIDPELASSLDYIVSSSGSATRAADIGARSDVIWEED